MTTPDPSDRPITARPASGSSAPSPWRASAVFLLALLLFAGFVYPVVFGAVADGLVPGTAGGDLIRSSNGTIVGIHGIGENVTNPAMFWLRPSEIDYQAFEGNGTGAGNEIPPGPTDPALVNETDAYIAAYCGPAGANGSIYCLGNGSVPVGLVTPSASGLDPDLTPAGVLVQIPRVAHFSNLSQEFLRMLVNRAIVEPFLGAFGTAYVNVLSLDETLLPYLPPGSGY